MGRQASSDPPRRRLSTRGEFWKKRTLQDFQRKANPFPGGDRYVIRDLTDEQSEAFWSAIERRD